MAGRFHGVFSLLLIFGSLVAGVISVFDESWAMGTVYIAIILFSMPMITYSFCSKCMCRIDSCGHVLPGRLTKLLPARKQVGYTALDILGLVVPMMLLLGFPQFWLWKNTPLLIVFWVLVLIGLTEVKLFVCAKCTNERCPMYTQPSDGMN